MDRARLIPIHETSLDRGVQTHDSFMDRARLIPIHGLRGPFRTRDSFMDRARLIPIHETSLDRGPNVQDSWQLSRQCASRSRQLYGQNISQSQLDNTLDQGSPNFPALGP
ncbi:hypothetical protein CDAR_116591 [Caerostris darwini]|uniref:Uncharacterized protein n=1 Tax=Caerostris darwini TaxID=1538125 RepID=A0AAV4R1D8_9ARAC|nr:hypothetical protein CDAR_116591 [Caerostris darwini]